MTIEEYIVKQRNPQKEIIQTLRNIILKNFPNLKEDMKLGALFYGDKYYLVGLKDHVNLGLSIKNMSKENIAKLSGSGKTFKIIEYFSLGDIDKKEVIEYLKMVI
jgi:hypothetical protein